MEASALNRAGAAGIHARSPLLRLQSDERLVALTRRGSNHAFEALVARYESRLLAFCRHMLASREDAEDVLQEVFAAAFNAMLADEREINVRPWLYRIARNRSLNHLRRAQAVGVDSMDIHLAEGGLTTADKVHRREEFRLLISDVQDLPETQKTALLLREIDALSYDQIAEAMETTVPSVKSLLVRARVSLAEASEARGLSCAQVRTELGEVAEGLTRTTAPVRRHLRSCERCQYFRKQLRSTNKALAAVFPVGPLLLLKKLTLAHLGTSAAAGGGAAAATGGGGGAAAGFAASGALQAGVQAVATKAAAGLAAAAIVTAGAVEVKHVAVHRTSAATPTSQASTIRAATAAPAAATPSALSTSKFPAIAPGVQPPAPRSKVTSKPAARVDKPDAPAPKPVSPVPKPVPASTTVTATAPAAQVAPAAGPPAPPTGPGPVTQVESDTTTLPTDTAATPAPVSGALGPQAAAPGATPQPGATAQPAPSPPAPQPVAPSPPAPAAPVEATQPRSAPAALPGSEPDTELQAAPDPAPRSAPLPVEPVAPAEMPAPEVEPDDVAPTTTTP